MKKPIEIRENVKISSVYPVLMASPSEMVGIVDDNGRLKGTATKTSVTNKLVAGGNANEPIERAMYKEPLQIRDDKTLNEAMKMINENKVDKLPVVDDEGRQVGTLSRKDLLEKARSFLKLRL